MTEKDIIVGLNNIAAKYGYGKGTEPFTNDEWNTIFRAKGIIKHLTAENQRLKKEAAEQKSIAEHEHAKQMEWFSIAGDYKAENAALRKRLEKAVELPRIIHPNPVEWHIQYQYESGIITEDIRFSEAEAEARLKELQGGER